MAEGGFDFNKLAQQMGLGMGGQGGGEGTMLDDIGNKLSALLSKLSGFLPNLSNPQNAGLKSLDAAQGIQDKMIGGALKGLSVKRDNAIIGNEISKRFVREATGVHSAEQESIKVSAINIEPLPVGEARFAHMDVPHMPEGGFRPSGGPGGMSAEMQLS